ncbi:MAG TPA: hypothetical protein VME43_18110, partial [Bryobacteraceae bacterium]|nr:hypothetical protein [Bryobacteraceae bacterium]
ACVYPNLTTSQLQALDQGGTYASGAFDLTQVSTTASGENVVESSIGGSFSQLTGFELSSAVSSTSVSVSGAYTVTTIGSCTVYQGTYTGTSTSTTTAIGGGVSTALDAGTITINGPTGSNISNEALKETNNSYSLTLGESGITGLSNTPNGVIVAGTYTLAGAGGQSVGSFSTSISLSPLTVSGGLPTSVTESSPLTISWTGGNASDQVEIIGDSEVTSGSGATESITTGEFICTTTAGQGSFTVPSAVLTLLPKTTSLPGSLGVLNAPAEVSFSPSLTSSSGSTVPSVFLGFTETASSVNYQ